MTAEPAGLMPFALDVALRVTILLALAAVIAACSGRAPASFRSLVWSLALTGALALPLLTALLPTWRIAVKSPPPAPVAAEAAAPAVPVEPPTLASYAAPADPVALRTLRFAAGPAADAPAAPRAPRIPWSVWIALVWVAGALLGLGRLALGLAAVRRIGRESEAATPPAVAEALSAARGALKARGAVQVRVATGDRAVTVPLTFGLRRPAIVLPAGAEQWPEDRLRAALLHELAHVRRLDWPVQIAAYVARSIWWFHPLVWWAARRQRIESEAACDDLALAAGISAPDYARQLLDVAAAARRGASLNAGAVAMAQSVRLERRVRVILEAGRRRGEVGRALRLAVVVAALCVLVPASVLRLTARTRPAVKHVAAITALTIPTVGKPAMVRPSARWALPATIRATDASCPVVRLSNGVTVTLSGVGDTVARSTGWWTPDGKSGATSITRVPEKLQQIPPGFVGRAFTVKWEYRLSSEPEGDERSSISSRDHGRRRRRTGPAIGWACVPDESVYHLTAIIAGSPRGLDQRNETAQLAMSFRPGVSNCTLRFGTAAGPWTRTVTCPLSPLAISVPTPSGPVTAMVDSAPRPGKYPGKIKRGEAVVVVTDYFGTTVPGTEVRSGSSCDVCDRQLQLIDARGRIVSKLFDVDSSHSPGNPVTTTVATARLSDLRRSTSLRLLARPFQWAEFRNVQLRPRTRAAEARPPLQSDYLTVAGSPTSAVTLPNGATVQLLGVKDTQSGPNAWWTPDGASHADGLPPSAQAFANLPVGMVGRAFAFQTRYAIASQPVQRWTGKFAWAGLYTRSERQADVYYANAHTRGKILPSDVQRRYMFFDHQEKLTGGQRSVLERVGVSFEAGRKECTALYAVAAGPWTASVSCPKKVGKTYIKHPSGDVIFTLLPRTHHTGGKPGADTGHAVFMESDHLRKLALGPSPYADYLGGYFDRCIQMLDSAGHVVYLVWGGLESGVDKTQVEATIPNTVLKRVASFRLLARPYYWVEFRNVPLQKPSFVR